jgi:hypothetical protein
MRVAEAQVPEAGHPHPHHQFPTRIVQALDEGTPPPGLGPLAVPGSPSAHLSLARDRVAAELLRHSGGRSRGPLEGVEGLAVLVQRPIAPADMTRADKAETLAAEMAPGRCPRRGVRDLAERREVRGAAGSRPSSRPFDTTVRSLRVLIPAAPSPPAFCGRVPRLQAGPPASHLAELARAVGLRGLGTRLARADDG